VPAAGKMPTVAAGLEVNGSHNSREEVHTPVYQIFFSQNNNVKIKRDIPPLKQHLYNLPLKPIQRYPTFLVFIKKGITDVK
jgi:hypothetical protein